MAEEKSAPAKKKAEPAAAAPVDHQAVYESITDPQVRAEYFRTHRAAFAHLSDLNHS